MSARAPSLWSRARSSWPKAPSRFPFARFLTAIPRSARMVGLAASGFCRARAGAFAGGRGLSEPGYLSQVAIRAQAASGFACGFRERGNVGRGGHATTVPEGKGLVLYLRIPPDGAYARYTAELYNPGGKPEGSFTIAPDAGQDLWSVTVPGDRSGIGNLHVGGTRRHQQRGNQRPGEHVLPITNSEMSCIRAEVHYGHYDGNPRSSRQSHTLA